MDDGVVVEQASFAGWDDCLRIDNGVVELIATTAVGPRVLSCRLSGGENLLYVEDDDRGATGGDDWRLYGGHRLWHAPEDHERTYRPDNDPVQVERRADGARFLQPTEPETGIQKSVSVALDPDDAVATVTHTLTNRGHWPVELSVWPVTVFRGGGRAVVPLSYGDPGPSPNRSLALWPDTDLDDDRIETAEEAVFVDQAGADPMKVGFGTPDAWACYVVDGTAFVKSVAHDPAAEYPDGGCTVEVYTDDTILELETLGPLTELDTGESATFTETWRLIDDVPFPESVESARRFAP